MEIFVTIVEAGQFTRAAQSLSLSKSSVSHALSDLEKYLGLQLISRNNRAWQLTDAGKSYYERCKKILADVAEIEDQVRKESGTLSGHIRLTTPHALGTEVIAPILARFMESYPDIIIEVILTERVVDLIEEQIDIAFRAGELKDSSLVARPIGETEMVLCASPEYLDLHGIPKTHADLKGHKCIRYSRLPHWTLFKNDKRYKFTPSDHLITNSGATYREFAILHQGIGFMTSILANPELKKGRLVRVLSDYEGIKLPVYAVRTGGSRVPNRVVALLDFIVDETRAMPEKPSL